MNETRSSPDATIGTSRGRWIIAAAVLGSGVATLDATVVGIALPAISRSFHSGLGTLQWVVSGYLVTLAAFLLVGGWLGDRFGRRRIFVLGIVWFALASAVCGLAPGPVYLIVARVLQGVGAALLTPASLAILQASFRQSDRARAIGAWSGLGGIATAIGPLVGGYLISVGSWRWVFFINLPVSAGVLVLTLRHVPESRDPTVTGSVDVAGASLAVAFLAGLAFGLIEAPASGWSSTAVLVALCVAAISGPGFVVVELHRADPMLPLRLFRQRQFDAANAVTLVVYAALGGALFLLPVTLQVVSGYSALTSGLALLPVTAIMLVFSARSGRLAARIGPRLQMSTGPVVVGAGMVLLTRVTHGTDYVLFVLPAVVVLGTGLALTVAPLTATAMGAVAAEHAGMASAVNNVVARAAALLAVAVLPIVAGLGGITTLSAADLAGGFGKAVVIAGVLAAAGGVLAAFTVSNRYRAGSAPPPSRWHCALDAAPLQPSTQVAVIAQTTRA